MTRLSLAAAFLAASSACALAAGSIPLSLAVQFDAKGKPLAGCKLYTYQAGTTTPQSAYQDSALTLAHSNPVECDATGRLPQLFFADGSIKVRLTDAIGNAILAADGILVIGASSGSGGSGSSVDEKRLLTTGDVKVRWGTGPLDGYVRANGRTIGNASSGASERANSDTQALWEYLCTNDTMLRATISGGYSGSCATDYSNGKTITLPDARGRVLAGLDDMGASAAGRLTSTYFGTGATTLGAAGGSQSHQLTLAQMPTHNHGGTTGDDSPDHTHVVGVTGTGGELSAGSARQFNTTGGSSGGASTRHQHSISNAGSDTPHNIVQPTILITTYIKL